jgi:uncharacterized protein (DUF885 family)
MRLSAIACAVLCCTLLSQCTEAPVATAPVTVASEKIDAATIYQQGTAALFQARPLSATAYSLTEQQVGKRFNNAMEFYHSSAENTLRSQMQAAVSALQTLPTDVDAQQIENQQVMANIFGFYAGAAGVTQGYIDMWMGHSPFIINQINGPVIDMAGALVNSHAINNAADATNYLVRLEQFAPALKAVGDKFTTDVQSDWVPPRVLLEKTVKILESYGQADVTNHPLYKDFATKVAALADVPQAERDAWLAQANTLVSKQIAPAFLALKQQVNDALPHAKLDAGIWAQPGGDAFYAYSVKQLGDTDLSPEQIHQIGLAEVKRITADMDKILKAHGYSEGSVGDRMAALNEEPRFLYADSDAGRAELLADLNGYIAEMDQRIAEQFATRPPYPVEVRRIPVEVQDSAAGGQYTSPAIDGSKPGIYWINLADMKANAKFDLKTLTYHEANPGHHWQIALNLAQEQLPLLRRIAPYNAYAEGWGLYAEQVGYEMGMYKGDPFGDLGRLKAELFRSVRLVVDTGMHAKHWSREQAIQYMASTTGTASSDVISEIERYMAWPGQALGYKLGMLKIIELREYARKTLGDRFDIKAFHDLVLLGGAVPMSVLDSKVKFWVNQQQSATATAN